MPNYIMEEVRHARNIPAQILIQSDRPTENFVPPHWHRELELNLQVSGTCDFVVSGTPYTIGPGQLFVVNSRAIHSGKMTAASEANRSITIQWDYDLLLRYCPQLPHLFFSLEKDLSIQDELREKVLQVEKLYQGNSSCREMKITALLLEIAAQLIERCSLPLSADNLLENERYIHQMQKAIDYIHQHYTEELQLPAIASHMNMTPTYFSRRFRQLTGTTFHECLMQHRLTMAVRDLTESDLTVTEIAYRNGFPNVKSFIDYFKREYHTTPQRYRRG